MKSIKKRWPESIYGIGSEPDPRTSLANERTALAGIRTALALVATSIAMVAVISYFDESARLLKLIAMILAVSGSIISIGAILHWVNVEKALRLKKPLPSPHGLVTISVLIAIIGLIAIISLITV